MTQWHPLFAQLLRGMLESQFEVQTNMPVGDVPREADVVLVRRISVEPSAFTGLWRWLTTWNILEFKGPSVSARVDDLDGLLEIGLGIQRRLTAADLGRRFLAAAERLTGPLEALADGVWRVTVWQRPMLLVSNREVAVERDSLPVHLLTAEPLQRQREVVEVLRAQPQLWSQFVGGLVWLHPALTKEMATMGRTKTKGLKPDIRPAIRHLGWEEILGQAGLKELIEQVGAKPIINEIGLAKVASQLSAAQRQEMLRLLQQMPSPSEPPPSLD
jgi:hypothetical protein